MTTCEHSCALTCDIVSSPYSSCRRRLAAVGTSSWCHSGPGFWRKHKQCTVHPVDPETRAWRISSSKTNGNPTLNQALGGFLGTAVGSFFSYNFWWFSSTRQTKEMGGFTSNNPGGSPRCDSPLPNRNVPITRADSRWGGNISPGRWKPHVCWHRYFVSAENTCSTLPSFAETTTSFMCNHVKKFTFTVEYCGISSHGDHHDNIGQAPQPSWLHGGWHQTPAFGWIYRTNSLR